MSHHLLPRLSGKGKGLPAPLGPHQHWHVDISYVNLVGTFYYLCSLLDGYSRYLVHWEIRESMTEGEVELILQRGREKFPKASPRIISDNGRSSRQGENAFIREPSPAELIAVSA